ncbi:hypothetical protein HAX54_007898 [Datura stramonium]|uniref:Uncharacterized protein n=1 Tax=Datura stramonium TaxID=4076 RepID=A0ABS8TCB8_DATST|nr:hypothetical protein [Datura stramonium]
MFEARHEDGKRVGNSAGRGRGFGAQDRPLAPNLGTHEAEDVRTCRPTWAISFVTVLAPFIVIVLAFEIQAHGTCRACVQAVDDSRARRACARAWALACARTRQTRRETRSWQAQAGARTRQTRRETRSGRRRQPHARGKCSAKSGTDPGFLGTWLGVP